MPIYCKELKTPVGKMIAGANDNGICLFDFEYRKMLPDIKLRIATFLKEDYVFGGHPLFKDLEQQTGEYFEGKRMVFDLPLQLAGSPFQVKVWEGLLEIPYGEKRTYKQQAIAYGDQKAIRAIASANGANGIAIIVPCHRVVGSNGSLTGYGGGLERKRWLLEHEQKHSLSIYQKELF